MRQKNIKLRTGGRNIFSISISSCCKRSRHWHKISPAARYKRSACLFLPSFCFDAPLWAHWSDLIKSSEPPYWKTKTTSKLLEEIIVHRRLLPRPPTHTHKHTLFTQICLVKFPPPTISCRVPSYRCRLAFSSSQVIGLNVPGHVEESESLPRPTTHVHTNTQALLSGARKTRHWLTRGQKNNGAALWTEPSWLAAVHLPGRFLTPGPSFDRQLPNKLS